MEQDLSTELGIIGFDLGELIEYAPLSRSYQSIRIKTPFLPSWLTGARVEWHDAYGNRPDLHLHVDEKQTLNTKTLIYTRIGSWYFGKTDDGRAHSYWHTGTITHAELKVWRTSKGELTQWVVPGDGEWITQRVRATSQQDGFGGAHYWLNMDDGQPLVLRGPWDAGSPFGYQEIVERRSNGSLMKGEVSRELFVSAVQTFCPEAKMFLVHRTDTKGLKVEPTVEIGKPDWPEPKAIHMDIRRRLQEKLSKE